MNVTSTIQVTELVWTLVALPGLYLWFRNLISARQSRAAVIERAVGNGRLIFAKFAVKETTAWVVVEFLFVLLGVFGMTVEANQQTNPFRQVSLAACLIAASLIISYLGWKWKDVDEVLMGLARRRLEDKREAVQNVRETEQNHREVEQNDREELQDKRDSGQSPDSR